MISISMQSKHTYRATTVLVMGLTLATLSSAFTPSTQPPEASAVPGNLLLALSVEFPTGLQESYASAYNYATKYDGYFDNRKCYTYSTSNEVFTPVSKLITASGTTNSTCPDSSQWSGNLLNWLTMTNIDQFRYVMTGGTRDNFSSMNSTYPGDTTARTVLIRSSSDRNSYVSRKTLTGLRGMPLSGTKYARSGGFGSKFVVSSSNSGSNPGGSITINRTNIDATCGDLPTADGETCFHVRVETCISVPVGQVVPDVGREANCKSTYSGVAKPEGLIQEYANSLRYGAVGYLNESGQSRNGGVLRSAMKSVGAVAATATGVTANTAAEWDASTGIMIANPDPSDATASTVSNSGLMNYLNKFGFAAGYKGNDPVSEMYYASQLYMRGKTPPTNYSDSLDAAKKDGFPVITGDNLLAGGSRDPILNSCQKNFILGIGDIYTHCDGNLPGSTKGLNSTCTTTTPSDANSLNVQSLWSTVSGLEGIGDTAWVGGATSGTPYMAGLAHWANTNDIRTDLTGKQTVSTYWVDVLENNATNVYNASRWKTQFWLAAKYGGFDTDLVTGNDPNTNILSWDKNSDGIPDNWFAGSDPLSLKTGLSAAFADIAVRAGVNSASSAAVTSNRQTASSQIIYAGYNPKGWLGTVRACAPTQTAAQCDTSPTWESSKWFKTTTPTLVTTPLTPTTRKIFTFSGTTSPTGVPFLYDSLSTAQKAVLDKDNQGVTDSQGAARVAFIRGDRSNESLLFRKREDTLLGDIVNAGVSYLSGAGPQLPNLTDTAYLAFRACNKSGCSARPNPRRPVVYAGANDGMLHAFSGTNGKELFAYIPGAVLNNLPTLTSLGYTHQFYVDSTPMIGDVAQNSTTWRTVLVGGLGAGGKGYYALNITDQNAFSTAWSATTLNATPSNETATQAATKEAALSTMPMWEFTSAQDGDLGYTFNEPAVDPIDGRYTQIARVADGSVNGGVWRVLVGNGYGATAGKAVLFMLDANSGTASTKLQADAGPNNGLSAPTPVDTDRDGLIDTIYAGDILGNMHKFQFSKLNTSNEYVLATAGSAGGGAWRHIGTVFASAQPITTAPSVAQACGGSDWYVAFGTGKLNENNDYTDTSARGFYAIKDTNVSSALTVAASDVVDISYTATTASGYPVRNWTKPNLTNKRGWKMAFTDGERVLSNSTQPPNTGSVLFATTKPTGDVCAPGNSGFIMSVNFCTGKSGDLNIAGVLVGGLGMNSTGVIKVSNTYTSSSNTQAVVSNQGGTRAGGGGGGDSRCTVAGKACKPSSRCPSDQTCEADSCPTGQTCQYVIPEFISNIAPKGRYSWRELFTK